MKATAIKVYNRDYVDFSTFQEQPINKQLFEGYLYLDYGNDKCLKRLFRFNGETLVCLSPTIIFLPSRTTNSTKDASESLYTLLSGPVKDYYHVPEWTMDIASISSIILLKQNNSENETLAIQSLNGIRRSLKSPVQEDLKRWAFVLSKMWKPQPAIKQQKSGQRIQVECPRNRPTSVSSLLKPAPKSNVYLTRDEIQRSSLAQSIPTNKTKWIEEWMDSVDIVEMPESSDIKRLSSMYEPLEQDLSSVSSCSIKTKSENCSVEKLPVKKTSFHAPFFQDVDTTEADETSICHSRHPLAYHNSHKAQRVKIVKQPDSNELSPTSKKYVSYLELDKSPLEEITHKEVRSRAQYTSDIYKNF